MRQKLLFGCAILMLAMAATVVAADVSGKWAAERQTPNGSMTTTFTFKMDGAKLTGTVSGRNGDTEIGEGKIAGDEISFMVVRKMGEFEMKQLYKGKVAGDEIKFTVEMQMPPGGMGGPGGGMGAPPSGGPGGPGGGMGGPGGGMGGGPRGPQEMTAKRVK